MIKLENFSCGYGKQPVLQNINLEIPNGKIVAVIGNNGSGKSTLAQVLGGIKLDFRGKVFLDDLKLSRITPIRKIRRKTGIVFQNPDNQIIFSRVSDDLRFILGNLNFPKNQQDALIQQALSSVDMLEYIDSNPRELSGGQKQRIAIASALVAKPEYLILDEATSMLDSKTKRSIYNILQKLKAQGITSILTTNWLDELIIADEVLILADKNIHQYTYNELLEKPGILTKYNLEIPLTLKLATSHIGQEFLC